MPVRSALRTNLARLLSFTACCNLLAPFSAICRPPPIVQNCCLFHIVWRLESSATPAARLICLIPVDHRILPFLARLGRDLCRVPASFLVSCTMYYAQQTTCVPFFDEIIKCLQYWTHPRICHQIAGVTAQPGGAICDIQYRGDQSRIGRPVKITRLTGGDLHLQFDLSVIHRSESGSYTRSWQMWLRFPFENADTSEQAPTSVTVHRHGAITSSTLLNRLTGLRRL
ncbi:hypothetical protein KCU93_g213, partial [Aureobasidium melanogenum]